MTNPKFPYRGERNGMKCMRCKRCGLIQEVSLWYIEENNFFCKECVKWTEMISLDNEELDDKKFNPTMWIPNAHG